MLGFSLEVCISRLSVWELKGTGGILVHLWIPNKNSFLRQNGRKSRIGERAVELEISPGTIHDCQISSILMLVSPGAQFSSADKIWQKLELQIKLTDKQWELPGFAWVHTEQYYASLELHSIGRICPIYLWASAK